MRLLQIARCDDVLIAGLLARSISLFVFRCFCNIWLELMKRLVDTSAYDRRIYYHRLPDYMILYSHSCFLSRSPSLSSKCSACLSVALEQPTIS